METSNLLIASVLSFLIIAYAIHLVSKKREEKLFKNAIRSEDLNGEKPQLLAIKYDPNGKQFYKARLASKPKEIFYLVPPEDLDKKRSYDQIIHITQTT